MKRYIILIAGLFVFVSCSRKPKSNEFKIEGFLSNGENRVLILNEISPNGNILIDSLRIDKNGEFEYVYRMPYKSFYTIGTDKNEFIALIPDYYEIIKISGDYEQLSPTYEVSGSADSELLWLLNKKELEGISVLNNVYKTWEEYTSHEDKTALKQRLDSLYYETWLDQKSYYYDFIKDNKGSLSTIMALYKTFNHRKLFPIETEAELYEEVFGGLREKIPDNPHTKHFERSYRRKTVRNDK